MTTLTVSNRPASDVKADALVLLVVKSAKSSKDAKNTKDTKSAKGTKSPKDTKGASDPDEAKAAKRAALAPGHGLGAEATAHIEEALVTLEATGRLEEVLRLVRVPGVVAPLVLLVGVGEAPAGDTAYGPENLRRAVGAATRALTGLAKAVVVVPADDEQAVSAAAEGALLGAYEFGSQRGHSTAKVPVKAVTLLSPLARDRGVRAAVKRAVVVAEAQNYVRDLVNTPPNQLYPATFADSVRRRAAGGTVKVGIMDEKALAKAGCGGILGVGQGSARPPRIVTLTYRPARAKATLALVGKGITFDSGGLWLKPGPSMVTMKCDMAGAAAVAAAVFVVAELGLPVAVTGYLCLAENMTGSDAQRPGDVVTMRGGKTVEIINTDAEGRLAMADGLVLAGEQRPDAIVDIATLTGAAVVALGNRTAGVLANDDTFRDTVTAAATGAGEPMWPMPLPEEIRPTLDSAVADLKHVGDKAGGMLSAAAFLRDFIPESTDGQPIPWAHLDIAGPAFNEGSPFGYTPKGGTGYGVRTLVNLVQAHA